MACFPVHDIRSSFVAIHRGAAVLAFAALMPGGAEAQQYPAKTVRVVVAFVPGGADDFHGRLIAQKMAEQFGSQVIVDNRGGAGGLVGWESVSRAPADGYTLLLGGGSLSVAPSIRRNLPFDVLKDFTPVSLVARFQLALVVHPSVPARSVKDLIALARARPGKLNFASSGVGATPHLSGELFRSMAKIDVVHVPYKGSAPAYIDLMGGQVDMLFSVMGAALAQIRAGKVRPLGVTGPQRALALPEIPAIAETLPGFELTSWYAILGPGGLPRNVVIRANEAVVRAVAQPDTRERLIHAGSEPASSTPEELGELVRSDVARFARIVRIAGIQPE